jgi:hypothetical protein
MSVAEMDTEFVSSIEAVIALIAPIPGQAFVFSNFFLENIERIGDIRTGEYATAEPCMYESYVRMVKSLCSWKVDLPPLPEAVAEVVAVPDCWRMESTLVSSRCHCTTIAHKP